jgi:hypothetical protein
MPASQEVATAQKLSKKASQLQELRKKIFPH